MDWIELVQEEEVGWNCENDNDVSGSIKSGLFIDWLRTDYFLKCHPAVFE
jgi:hypothetical protein